ncbi:MAG: hypothetical protein IJ192_05505 [Clostridia bacterium]|nr:hypothetical protein [Clostridia bacterium]
MNALIISSNPKINSVLCNQLKKYYDFQFMFADGAKYPLKNSDVKSADIIFISMCSEENNPPFPEQIHHYGSVIFLIGDDEKHAVLAYQYRFDGFIHVNHFDNDLQFCMEKFALLSKRRKPILAETFGWFNIFVNDVVVNFHSAKAKELLALCIDRRGGEITMDEAIDKLWPDRRYDDKVKRLYRKSVMILNKTFKKIGIPDAFVAMHGSCCIIKDRFECDYFKFFENINKNHHLFDDEYMFNYSWAKETLVNLQEIKSNYLLKSQSENREVIIRSAENECPDHMQ